MRNFVGGWLIAIFAALALLHVYWAMGGQAGRSAAIPSINGRKLFDPSAGMTFAVAVGLMFAAGVIGGRLGWLGERVPFRALTFAVSALFLLRATGDFRHVGFFKKASDSAFARWDTRLYSPLCLSIGAATFYLACSPN